MTIFNQSFEDTQYGAFRLMRGSEVLKVGFMNELEVTQLCGEIEGTHIEHQNTDSLVWKVW